MKQLDIKLNEHFGGKVVRKDLTSAVKGNAIVPTYVLEYLLGQYCATDDEVTIEHGVETVKNIIGQHFVHRDEAQIVKSTVREKGSHRIIDKLFPLFIYYKKEWLLSQNSSTREVLNLIFYFSKMCPLEYGS